jgi:hypothetical protein
MMVDTVDTLIIMSYRYVDTYLGKTKRKKSKLKQAEYHSEF